jgi:tetratricopeptide (TPR) repeat protein
MGANPEKLDIAIEHHEAGRLDQAAKLYREVLSTDAQNADALHLLGLALHQQSQHESGIENIRRALALKPTSIVFLTNFGAVLHETKRFDEAIDCYWQALQVKPDHPSALTNLALTLRARVTNLSLTLQAREKLLDLVARFESALAEKPQPDLGTLHLCLGHFQKARRKLDAAEASYRQVLRFNPESVEAFENLGIVLKGQGKLDEAIAAYGRALQCDPKLIGTLNNMGNALTQRGQLGKAIDYFQQALEIDAGNATIHVNLGAAQREQGDLENAVNSFRQALKLVPNHAKAHSSLGAALADLGQQAEADNHFGQALEIDPNDAEVHYNLGMALASQGHFDQAVASYERATNLRPDFVQAFQAMAECLDSTDDSRRLLPRLEELLAKARLTRQQRSQLHFAIGRIFDKNGEWAQAFGHYQQANSLVDTEYDDGRTSQRVAETIETFTSALLDGGASLGVESELPVLIVGMPRSGTSLVEQILAAHPGMFGAGELADFGRTARGLPARLGSSVGYPTCIKELDRETCTQLADEYIGHLRSLCGEEDRVTDKMPGNFWYLGLIALILPTAKVIHCRRHPLDVCLSCYFQNFTYADGLRYAFDLRNLGLYYRQYATLMEHWRKVLPLPFLEVDYEELVTGQEEVSRQLVEFCGMPWDPACLDFGKNRRVIRTASVWQARQPIYTTSVKRWKQYEEFLDPLKEALEWTA